MVNGLSVAVLIAGAAAWAAAPSLLGLPDAFALWLGVGSAAALQAASLLRIRRRMRLNLRSTSTSVHRVSHEFDPVVALHLHRSQLAVQASATPVGTGMPPYVRGEIDGRVDRALDEHRFVLIVGNALSGKSRVAFEAIRRNFPRAEIWVPSGPSGLRVLLECDPPLSLGWRPVVVWLDELDYYLTPRDRTDIEDEGLVTEALIARHLVRQPWWRAWRLPHLLFVATMSNREHDTLYDRLFQQANRSQRRVADIVALAQPVELADGADAGWDMAEAERVYPGLDLGDGIGRTFAEAEAMLYAYRSGADEIGRGLVRSAVDWRRIGLDWPSRTRLHELLATAQPGRIVAGEEFERGLLWANQEIAGGRRLLSERPSGERGGVATFVADPLLVDADEGYGSNAKARPVPEGVWELALGCLDAPELFAVAEEASERDKVVAERILLRLADSDLVPNSDELTRSVAQLMLGWLYLDLKGRENEATERFIAASRSPDADTRVYAHVALGQMLGREPQADAEFTAAISIEGASPDTIAAAWYERGNWRNATGRTPEAEVDFSTAIASGKLDREGLAWAFLKRSYIYEESGRPNAQQGDLEAAIELHADPNLDAMAYFALGASRHEPEHALEDFTAALACDSSPDSQGAAYCIRGETLAALERFDEAEADYAAAVALDGASPDSAATWRLDRIVTLGGRDIARDRADCDWVIANAGVSREILGRGYLARAKLEDDRLLRRDGWSKDRVQQIGADLGKAIELGDVRDGAEARYLRGGLLSDGYGTPEAALEDLTIAIETQGADPHTVCSSYVHRALMHRSEGRYEEAERDFALGISTPEATPRSVAVGLVDRGLMRWELGRKDLAEEDFRAAIHVKEGGDPSAGALRYLGDLLRAAGRFEEERALFHEAVASGRPELEAVALPHLEAEERRRKWRAERRDQR